MKRTTDGRPWGRVAVAVLMATAGWGVWAHPAWASTLPASDAPPTVSGRVQVSTAVQLEYIDQNQLSYLNSYIELMNNIDLTGYSWSPLGGNAAFGNGVAWFSGTFNGQGHEIIGLNMDDTTDQQVGFFGGATGTIKNVGLIDPVVKTPYSAGALVGYQAGGNISNSYATGVVVNGSDASGGLVGYQSGGSSISDSYATGSVSGGVNSGGLVGAQNSGSNSISDSYATSSVSGGNLDGGLVGAQYGSISDSYATGSASGAGASGGLVGYQAGGTISGSYATGAASGAGFNGGLAGQQVGGSINDSYATGSVRGGLLGGGLVGAQTSGSINDSYAIGSVSGGTFDGGLVGEQANGTISGCYFDTGTTSQSNGVGGNASAPGVTGESTPRMQTQATFADWNFTSKWGIAALHNGGFPYLQWQYPASAWTPPTLTAEPVTVGGVSYQVIGNLGYNSVQAIQQGTFAGYIEERAAIEAGATFSGEGTDSAYLSAILDGSGVGLQHHVTAVQQGQFAALYQKLGIIPTWTDNAISIPQGVTALLKASASPLAIENYLVQVGGFSWVAAQVQVATGFPIQF